MGVVFAPLLAHSVVSSSPAAKVSLARRLEVPPNTRIIDFHEMHSFGDGPSYSGIISVRPEFVERLKSVHAMKATSPGMLDDLLPAGTDVQELSGFSGAGLVCYYDFDRSLLYFRRPFESRRR